MREATEEERQEILRVVEALSALLPALCSPGIALNVLIIMTAKVIAKQCDANKIEEVIDLSITGLRANVAAYQSEDATEH